MTTPSHIEADPQWLPHRIDLPGRRMQFLRIAREDIGAKEFLADRTPAAPQDDAWLPLDDVMAMRPDTGPLHFIFHTAFCRSTLLVRALDAGDISVGLSEPGIFAGLASGGEAVRPLVKPVLDLLSRPMAPGATTFVKPTNHANMLAPALMAARPDAKAVVMTNALPKFLGSVARRGLMGRRWGRQLYLETMGYAGMDLGMDAREQFSMTDMQAAGLAWFFAQRWFAMQMAGGAGSRFRVLDGDRFNENRCETLRAIAHFAKVDGLADRAESIAHGPLFAEHAKLGGAFAEQEEPSATAPEEAEQVGQWIGMIAARAGLDVPLAQTLF